MALQVWLPLTGHLENQGLDGEVVVQNTGATVNTNGKIGPCYAFDGTQKIAVTSTYLQNYLCSPSAVFSMACWIYLNSDETDRVIIFGNYTSNPFLNWELTSACKMRLCAGGTSNYITGADTAVVPKTTWTHLAVTYDGNKIEFYVNGEKTNTTVATDTITGALQHSMFYLGGDYRNDATRLKGRLNDFRFYDNVLSAKEIEMLSRGLTIHYPLAPPGGENLLPHTDIAEYGVGYLSPYSSGTVSVDNNVQYNGHATIKITPSSSSTSSGAVSTYNNDSVALTSGKTYTYSCMIYSTVADTFGFSSLGHYQTHDSSAAHNSTKLTQDITIPAKQWTKVWITFTANKDCSFRSFFIYFANTSQVIHVSDIKLEEGDKPTPWIPNKNDSSYAAFGFNDGIEYDVSGFQYNGEKYGDLKWSNNSAKYNACYEFDGASDYIRLKQDLYSQFRSARDEVTVNIWAYKDDWDDYKNSGSTAQWMTMCGCQEGGGFSIYEVGNGRFTFVCGTGASSNSYKVSNTATGYADSLSSGWHMFTLTFDGLSLKGYVDGNLVVSNAFFTTKTPIYYNTGTTSIYIGVESGSGKQAGLWWKGKLSDFRVYTTALSPDAIKELFHTGQTLTNTGVLMSNEITET